MKKSILIVGESDDFCSILSAILMDKYKVFRANTSTEVLEAAKTQLINLIITSPKLTGDSCFDLAKKLRQSENANSDAPIVLAANVISADTLSKAHKSQIVDVLKLPLEPLELENKVGEILLKYARSYEKPDPVTGLQKKLFGEEQIVELLENEVKGTLMLLEVCRFSFASSKISSKSLAATGEVLKGAVSKSSVLCVAAGGGFMIFEPSLRDKTQIDDYAKKLIETLNTHSETKNLFISIGLAVTDRHGANFKDLYLACDMGLGIARQDGRNKACFYKW